MLRITKSYKHSDVSVRWVDGLPVTGFALGKHVLIQDKWARQATKDGLLAKIEHERVHVRDFERFSVLFWISYILFMPAALILSGLTFFQVGWRYFHPWELRAELIEHVYLHSKTKRVDGFVLYLLHGRKRGGNE